MGTPYKRWIETLGGRVIAVQELAIQEQLVSSAFNRDCGNCLGAKGPNPDLAGVFLRMQIPFLIDEHKLFSLPGVCDSNVIYTDSDTFWNPTSADQLRAEMDFFASAPQVAVKYSTEQFRNQHKPFNTGVMFMNVPQWQNIWPSMLQFGVQRGFAFPSFDQGWINEYFVQHPGGRAYLDEHWNWKVYWGNDTVTAPRTVHFHGPKPGQTSLNRARIGSQPKITAIFSKPASMPTMEPSPTRRCKHTTRSLVRCSQRSKRSPARRRTPQATANVRRTRPTFAKVLRVDLRCKTDYLNSITVTAARE